MGERITAQLVSSLTGSDLTKQENMLLLVFTVCHNSIQTSQTGDQQYSDPSPYNECSLVRLWISFVKGDEGSYGPKLLHFGNEKNRVSSQMTITKLV